MESKQSTGNVSRGATTKAGVSAKLAADQSTRLKGYQIVKPIIFGNISWFLGKKREEDGHTHQWTVYLKPYETEDLSVFIKKVHFKLHDSYSEPNRVCHSPPYSVSETGWGEFDVAIKVFFNDSNERPVTIYHFLKLFDRDKDGNVNIESSPVTSEFYDELVFMDPTLKMHRLLTNPKPILAIKRDIEAKKAEQLKKILIAKKKVKEDIAEAKAKLIAAKEEISQLKSIVSQLNKMERE